MASQKLKVGGGIAGGTVIVFATVLLLFQWLTVTGMVWSDYPVNLKAGGLFNYTLCGYNDNANQTDFLVDFSETQLFTGSYVLRNIYRMDARYKNPYGATTKWANLEKKNMVMDFPWHKKRCARFEIEKDWGSVLRFTFNPAVVIVGYNWSEVYNYTLIKSGLTGALVRINTFFPAEVIINQASFEDNFRPDLTNGVSARIVNVAERELITITSSLVDVNCSGFTSVYKDNSSSFRNSTCAQQNITITTKSKVYDDSLDLQNGTFYVEFKWLPKTGFQSHKWGLNISGVYLDPAINSSWLNITNITISVGISASSTNTLLLNLTNFTLLRELKGDCTDIRFTEIGGTDELAYDIRRCISNKSVLVEVNVSKLSQFVNLSVYSNYGQAPDNSDVNAAFDRKIQAIYRLDDGTFVANTSVESATGQFNGTEMLANHGQDGMVGQSFLFDVTSASVNHHFKVTQANFILYNWTIMMWAKFPSSCSANGNAVAGSWTQPTGRFGLVEVEPGGDLRGMGRISGTEDVDYRNTIDLCTNDWNHIAYQVWSNKSDIMYLNGSSLAETSNADSGTAHIILPDGDWDFGAYFRTDNGDDTWGFGGYIDEIMIWANRGDSVIPPESVELWEKQTRKPLAINYTFTIGPVITRILNLSGVVNNATGSGIPNITVFHIDVQAHTLANWSRTNINGRYNFTGVPRGNYTTVGVDENNLTFGFACNVTEVK